MVLNQGAAEPLDAQKALEETGKCQDFILIILANCNQQHKDKKTRWDTLLLYVVSHFFQQDITKKTKLQNVPTQVLTLL